MTEEEIHDFGIQIVMNQLKKEKYEIFSHNSSLGINPQILARKRNQLCFILVRTECYPEKGKLKNHVQTQILKLAAEHDAVPYFASVGIARSDSKTEEEMATPVRGAGYFASYDGLWIIADSNQISIWDKQNKTLRDVRSKDLE